MKIAAATRVVKNDNETEKKREREIAILSLISVACLFGFLISFCKFNSLLFTPPQISTLIIWIWALAMATV